jgi:hypothetical protein
MLVNEQDGWLERQVRARKDKLKTLGLGAWHKW